MKTLAASLFLASCATICVGQKPIQYPQCMNTARTQYELNICAYEGTKQADAEINRVYARLLAKLASDANAIAKVRTMERAWIVYRDAYIEAMYPALNKQAEYGSMFPMEAANLRTELTQKQIDALNRLLQGDNPEGK